MPRTIKRGATNLEVYREALDILDDFNGFDAYWYQDETRFCAVTATILYQLLQMKEENKDESI